MVLSKKKWVSAMLEARMKAAAEKNAKKTVVMMTEPAAALKMQAVHRGNLSRSGRLKLGGQPYSPSQRRRLEDALSIAVNASLGLEVGARLGFIARHVAAQHHGRTPPEAPPRVGKLNAKQSEELAPLLEAVQLAVCQCNTMRGLPLRNVAEHLFAQHMLEKNRPPQASKDEMRGAARRLGMRGGAARHATMKFTNLPDAPTPREAQEAEDKRIEAERTDPVTIRAREAGTKAFAKYDKQKRGFLKKEDLFECMLGMGQVPGTNKQQQQAYLDAEFAKADADQSGTVDFDEFVTFYVKVVHAEEAEKAARTAFARFDVSNDNQLQKRELFQVLVELGMVTGDTKLEKELNLEEEFKKADLDSERLYRGTHPANQRTGGRLPRASHLWRAGVSAPPAEARVCVSTPRPPPHHTHVLPPIAPTSASLCPRLSLVRREWLRGL